MLPRTFVGQIAWTGDLPDNVGRAFGLGFAAASASAFASASAGPPRTHRGGGGRGGHRAAAAPLARPRRWQLGGGQTPRIPQLWRLLLKPRRT
jgi:hypothetical protein